MKRLKQLTISLCALSTLSGCATAGLNVSGDLEQVRKEADMQANASTKTKPRKTNTLLKIGGILLLGAIIVHEAEDGATDALREASRPEPAR